MPDANITRAHPPVKQMRNGEGKRNQAATAPAAESPAVK
jgi:hypothetical protein